MKNTSLEKSTNNSWADTESANNIAVMLLKHRGLGAYSKKYRKYS